MDDITIYIILLILLILSLYMVIDTIFKGR